MNVPMARLANVATCRLGISPTPGCGIARLLLAPQQETIVIDAVVPCYGTQIA
jgi:hypothetical protein